MASHSFFVYILLTFSLSFHGTSAVINIPKFQITNEAANTPGGVKFEKIIGGIPSPKKIMDKIYRFAVSTVFQQNSPADQKEIFDNTIFIYIKDFIGVEGNAWGYNKINISAVYLDGYQGDLKWEFTSLLYHEMTHLIAFNGEYTMPSPLREGVADYMILKANYFPPGFAKPGSGDKWDQSYDFTARFLEYCDSVTPGGFVVKLNRMSKKIFDVKYFKDITGKPVDQLWKEYKAKYGQKDINT